MVKIEPFAVEQWMNEYETTPNVLNIAETCAASVSIQDLLDLSHQDVTANPLLMTKKLTYGPITGSDTLRRRIAALYNEPEGIVTASQATPPLPAEHVLVTPGAIFANFLLFYTLIQPGDHVICVYPTYQQLYSVPESLGAKVTLWRLKEENGYVPDLQELDGLVTENTKMIVINNPNNPTGAATPRTVLQGLVDFARKRNIIILSDEVYRPLFHSTPADSEEAMPPSILSLGYERTISTGSMSKAFSLAGIRLGWVASRDRGIIGRLAEARDYTTISVSQLDDHVASFALSDAVRPALLRRNADLARTNLSLLDGFVQRYSGVCSWVRPQAGTTAFIRFKKQPSDGGAGGQGEGEGDPSVDDERLCLDVLEATKVMFIPGAKCFGHGTDFRGFVRIGYVNETDVLEEALRRLGDYVEKNLLAKQ